MVQGPIHLQQGGSPSQWSATLLALIVMGCLLFSFTVMGCEEERPKEEPIARLVKMMAVGAGMTSGVHEYPGKVKALQHADMGFEVHGRIIEFRFKEGQKVKKGDVLARLDPRDYQADLDAQVARENAARAEYERIQSLYEVEAASRQDLDKARRDFEVTRANVKQARKALEDTYLRAPFAGRFAKKLVEDFENVQAKQSVLTLQDNSMLKLVVNVPERDLAEGNRNRTVEEMNAHVRSTITISAIPDRTFPANIREFATTADPVTRTFEVTFVFKNPPNLAILPGMTARVNATEVGGSYKGTYSRIPANVVLADEGGASYVWLVDQSSMTVHKKSVELGELSGSEVEVRSGLAEGDLIAISGVRNLREGTVVRRLEDHRQ